MSLTDSFFRAAAHGDLRSMKHCITRGVDVDSSRSRAIIDAARFGHLDAVKYLVLSGSSIPDTAVSKAAEFGHLEVVKYLVENGARSTAVSDALMGSGRFGHIDVVRYLITKVPDTADKTWSVVIQDASAWGHLDVVKCLVEEVGVDIGVIDRDILTKIVQKWDHFELTRYFVEKGLDPHLLCEHPCIPRPKTSHSISYLISLGYDTDTDIHISVGIRTSGIYDHILRCEKANACVISRPEHIASHKRVWKRRILFHKRLQTAPSDVLVKCIE